MSKHFSCYGQYSVWSFVKGSYDTQSADRILYHQIVPQLYHPVDEILPFVVAVCAMARPIDAETLFRAHTGVRVPGGYWRSAGTDQPKRKLAHIHEVMEFMWDALQPGPYTGRSSRGRTGRRPNGAAMIWDVLDGPDGVKLGFTAFDEYGQPSPWLTVSPCPPDDFINMMRTDDTLSALGSF